MDTTLPYPIMGTAARRLPESEWEGVGYVYFLCQGRSIVYVGQTHGAAGSRVCTHRRKGMCFDGVYVIEVPIPKLNAEEARWIRICQPPYNTLHTSAYREFRKKFGHAPTSRDLYRWLNLGVPEDTDPTGDVLHQNFLEAYPRWKNPRGKDLGRA